MRTSLTSKTLSALGIVALGDAVAFAVGPAGHVRVWSFRHEPIWYARMNAMLLARPRRAWLAAALELAAGLALVTVAQRVARP